MERSINMLGLLDMKGNETVRRVYGTDGISPTLTSSQGGHRQPKIPTNFQSTFVEREWREDEMNGLKVNDFFCGAGGMGLGFKQAGFEIAGAWDFDKYAVESYKENVGDHVLQADVTEMKDEDVPHADVWTFGFPCQDLSIAGKQAGLFEGQRSKMFFEIMRLLGEVSDKPSMILAENVKGLKKFLPVLEEEYTKAGYKMVYTLFNSKYWGVAQNRERYFVAGIRNDLDIDFNFPEQQTDNVPRLLDFLEDEVDEKYYIDDIKALKIIEQLEDKLKVKQATKLGYDVATEGDAINISHPNSKTRRGRVGKGVAQTLLTGTEQVVVEPKELQKAYTTKDEIAFCCDANYFKGTSPGDVGKGRRTHIVEENPFRIRKLTPREYARLQGFPDTYKQVVSNSQFYKQMGNAVTVNVAYAIAKAIKESLS